METMREEITVWAQIAFSCKRQVGVVLLAGGSVLGGEVTTRLRYCEQVAMGLTDDPNCEQGAPPKMLFDDDDSIYLEKVTVLTGHGTPMRLAYLRVPWTQVGGYSLMRAGPGFAVAKPQPVSRSHDTALTKPEPPRRGPRARKSGSRPS